MTVLAMSCQIAYAQMPDFEEEEAFLFWAYQEGWGADEAKAYDAVGSLNMNAGRHERAGLFFAKSVSIDPDKYETWFRWGLINMDKPEPYFLRSIEANPNFAESYYWLASYYCRVEQTEDSIQYFEDYLKVVDADDSLEKSRIKTAKFYIDQMKAGIVDYDIIANKQYETNQTGHSKDIALAQTKTVNLPRK